MSQHVPTTTELVREGITQLENALLGENTTLKNQLDRANEIIVGLEHRHHETNAELRECKRLLENSVQERSNLRLRYSKLKKEFDDHKQKTNNAVSVVAQACKKISDELPKLAPPEPQIRQPPPVPNLVVSRQRRLPGNECVPKHRYTFRKRPQLPQVKRGRSRSCVEKNSNVPSSSD